MHPRHGGLVHRVLRTMIVRRSGHAAVMRRILGEAGGRVACGTQAEDQPLFAAFMDAHEQPETIDLPDVLPNLPKQSGY